MRPVFHLAPHTHWDREWYLPRAGFQARLIPLLDDLLDLLEREPDLRFHLDGQTVLIEDYLEVARERPNRPRASERLRALIEAGRLAIGPWYVLADELIPSAESLIRNLLLGTADARALGGFPPVLYSPDAFGHRETLPAIAAELGLRYGVVWRGLGRQPDGEHDLYRWRGPDGRSILLYHLPPAGYEIGSVLLGPNADLRERWLGIRDPLIARSRSRHVLVLVGADHHAAGPELATLAARLRAIEPNGSVRVSSLVEFFTAVEADAPTLSEIGGELRSSPGYTWSLQGVAATRSRQKRAHAAAELALERIAEPLATLAGLAPAGRCRADLVRTAWRRLVQSQFHDTIAGTVDDRVAREQAVRLDAVGTLSAEIACASLADLQGHDPDRARDDPPGRSPALVLWNPVPRRRSAIVTAMLTGFRRDVLVGPPTGRRARTGRGFEPSHLRLADGREIPLQILRIRPGSERIDAPRHDPDQDEVDRVYVALAAPPIEGLATVRLTAAPGARPVVSEPPAMARGRRFGNRHLAGRVAAAGTIDLRPAGGRRYRGLFTIEAEPDRGDTYSPSVSPGRPAVARPVETTVLAPGPLVAAIATSWRVRSPAGVVEGRTALAIDALSPVLRIRIDLDNRARDQRLRLRLPTGLAGPILAGTAGGQIHRPPIAASAREYELEGTVGTATAHRFVAMGDRRGGLAVLGPGAFEYEWTPKGDLLVTLVRSVGRLSRDDLPERPGHAGWPVDTPLAQEPGAHLIELALVMVDPATIASPAAIVRWWEDAFLPPAARWFRDFHAPAEPAAGGIELVGDDLSFEALKPAEDGAGVILRCINRSDRPGQGLWRFPWPLERATRARADETTIEPLPTGADRRSVAFDYGPRAMVTIRVEAARIA